MQFNIAAFRFSPYRKIILLILFYAHTAKAIIPHAKTAGFSVSGNSYITRVCAVSFGAVCNKNASNRLAGLLNSPTHHWVKKFERTVLHKFCIQTAISSKVDVFEKYSPHG